MKHLQRYPLINENSKSRSEEISEEKFKEILLSKCSNWNIDNQQIYRGIDRETPFIYINPKLHTRDTSSRRWSNIYNIIMDVSPLWKNFPKRSKSIICTNDYSFTTDYGHYIDDDLYYHIVIPFNNTKWAITPNDDLWFAYSIEELGVEQLANFNEVIYDVIDKLSNNKHGIIYTYENLLRVTNNIDYTDKENINNTINSVISKDWYQEQFKSYGSNTIIHKTLTSIRDAKNSKDILNILMNSLSPDKFNIDIYDENGIEFTKQTQECWSDGECLLIRVDYFKKIFG